MWCFSRRSGWGSLRKEDPSSRVRAVKKKYRYAHALLLRHHPLPDHLPGRPSPLSHKLFDSENRPRRVVVHVHIMILWSGGWVSFFRKVLENPNPNPNVLFLLLLCYWSWSYARYVREVLRHTVPIIVMRGTSLSFLYTYFFCNIPEQVEVERIHMHMDDIRYGNQHASFSLLSSSRFNNTWPNWNAGPRHITHHTSHMVIHGHWTYVDRTRCKPSTKSLPHVGHSLHVNSNLRQC